MIFWIVIIALLVLVLFKSIRERGRLRQDAEEKDRQVKEFFSRLKSIDKNVSKIRDSLKEKGKKENEKGEDEGKISENIEPCKPAKEKDK